MGTVGMNSLNHNVIRPFPNEKLAKNLIVCTCGRVMHCCYGNQTISDIRSWTLVICEKLKLVLISYSNSNLDTKKTKTALCLGALCVCVRGCRPTCVHVYAL